MPNRNLNFAALRALAALAALIASAATQAAPAFTPELQPIGYVAQPRSSTLDVRGGEAVSYFPDYERQHWSGNLKPFHVTALGKLDAEGDLWPGGAAPALNQLVIGDGGKGWDTLRMVVTLKDDGSRIPFRWSNLSKATKENHLGNNEKYLRFIRGQRSEEAPSGLKLRARRYVLGDIIRSRPVYVGGTVPMVYVGANDGMLHAFEATSGDEVYAYVPSMLIPKLMNLAPLEASGYTHTHFVDATPRSAAVKIGGVDKRILVGGLGAGGRGIWALDITADAAAVPANETAASNRILWEITPDLILTPGGTTKKTATTTYGNLGHTYGEPIVGKSNYLVGGAAQDLVFMANGFMNTMATPGVTKTGDGKAILFAINPADGAKVAEISTGSGTTASPNGLSSPTPVDTNGDGRIDYLYAGDLDGNLWRFDVTSSSPGSWSASLLYTTSPAQAITTAPVVADHPRGGRLVAFGTGRTLTDADMTDASVHYMYAIWDGAPGGATALLEQTLNAETAYVDTAKGTIRRVRTLSVNTPNWSTHRGWKVALPAGERVVGDRLTLTNRRVYFHSLNPTVNLAGLAKNPVEPVYENWEYQLDFLTGGGHKKPVYDLNLDGNFDNADLIADPSGTKPGNERVAAAQFLAAGVVSQPTIVTTTIGAQNIYNQNPDLPAIVLADPGVSGGHFDTDIYYPGKCDAAGVCTSWTRRSHNHEYDDKYGVTGVNMMNASQPALNVSNAVYSVQRTAPQTRFKVLLSHQYLNPAAQVRIGPSGNWAYVKDYGGGGTSQAAQTDAQALLDGEPAYTYDTVGNLVFGLPTNAFVSKDWWGNGNGLGNADIRAGLMPTTTGCVNGISDSNFASTPGAQGERHNGAFLVQLIRAATPASALEMVVAGKPEYGWRVKDAEYKKYMLAAWTFFWHHPNGKCYGKDAAWVKDPPQDDSGASDATPPPGTDDPRDGYFNAIGSNSGAAQCGGTLTNQTVTYDTAALKETVVRTFSSGCTMTIVTIRDGYGGVTITTTIRQSDGTAAVTEIKTREAETWRPTNTRIVPITGRVSWRELIRE